MSDPFSRATSLGCALPPLLVLLEIVSPDPEGNSEEKLLAYNKQRRRGSEAVEEDVIEVDLPGEHCRVVGVPE